MCQSMWIPTTGSAMDLARYVVDSVVLEGRSYREVARKQAGSESNPPPSDP
jgi:hypothetical protein